MKLFRLIFHIARTNIRRILYKFESLKFQKPNIENDNNFKLVPKLRNQGINIFKNYHEIDMSAKKILEEFDLIDTKIIDKVVSDKKKIHHKSSYRVYITEMFNRESLMSLARSEIIMRNVEQYFGFEPIIRYISVWLDRTNSAYKEGVFTQQFHRDYDDQKLVKLFYYLTDVGPDNGPFQFIQGSHKDPWLEFKDYKNNNIISAEALKGSLILADTNGFHRGLKLKDGFRILVSISYSSHKPKVGFRKDVFN